MAAFSYRPASAPTARQLNAIDLFIAGLHDAALAERLGLDRSTVSRWRPYDPAVGLVERRPTTRVPAAARSELQPATQSHPVTW